MTEVNGSAKVTEIDREKKDDENNNKKQGQKRGIA